MLIQTKPLHHSFDGFGLDLLEAVANENMKKWRLSLRGMFQEMEKSGFSLQDYLEDNKALLQEIGRDDKYLVPALLEINKQENLSKKDAYTILCALFDVEQDLWTTEKATRFVDLLVQVTAAGTKKTPKSAFAGGNVIIINSTIHLASMKLNSAPVFLTSLLGHVLDNYSQAALSICETLTEEYIKNSSFVFVPVLCDLFKREPETSHMAWSKLSQNHEDHPQWKEAVDNIAVVAKAYEDKKAIEGVLGDVVAGKVGAGRIARL